MGRPKSVYISSTSIVKDVKLGENIKIWHFCNLYGCEIGDNTQIGSYTEIKSNAKIGKNCRLQSHIFIPENVTIEDYVFLGPGVTFTNDKYPSAVKAIKKSWKLEKTLVKKYSTIGAGSVIGPGITLGEYSLVGMGSIVTKDVPDYAVVFGNPAKKIGDVRKSPYFEKYDIYENKFC